MKTKFYTLPLCNFLHAPPQVLSSNLGIFTLHNLYPYISSPAHILEDFRILSFQSVNTSPVVKWEMSCHLIAHHKFILIKENYWSVACLILRVHTNGIGILPCSIVRLQYYWLQSPKVYIFITCIYTYVFITMGDSEI